MARHRRRPRARRVCAGISGVGRGFRRLRRRRVHDAGAADRASADGADKSGDVWKSKIAGTAYLDDEGAFHQNPPRAQIADLDAQPWPARQAIDLHRYVDTWRTHHQQGSVNFITARGCPYKCRWCSHQVYGQTHRRRNPIKVVDELEWLLTEYTPDIAWVSDDVFTINHEWIRKYAAEMRRRKLHIPFECISRADRLNEEMLDLLAELGCFRIWIGSESGSQRLLDAMDRGVKVEQVQRAVEMSRARKIQSGMFLMWGYEGEEMEDIEATIRHVSKSKARYLLHYCLLSDQRHPVLPAGSEQAGPAEALDAELRPRHQDRRSALAGLLRVCR